MSLERIKTFEELSPNSTSMFEVSHDHKDTVLSVRSLPLSKQPPQAVLGQGGPAISRGQGSKMGKNRQPDFIMRS
jgi:hypothetical protein